MPVILSKIAGFTCKIDFRLLLNNSDAFSGNAVFQARPKIDKTGCEWARWGSHESKWFQRSR
jgi:hypothetical protein